MSYAVAATGVAEPFPDPGAAGAAARLARDLRPKRHAPHFRLERADDGRAAQQRQRFAGNPVDRERSGPRRIGRRAGGDRGFRLQFERRVDRRRVLELFGERQFGVRVAARRGFHHEVPRKRGARGQRGHDAVWNGHRRGISSPPISAAGAESHGERHRFLRRKNSGSGEHAWPLCRCVN